MDHLSQVSALLTLVWTRFQIDRRLKKRPLKNVSNPWSFCNPIADTFVTHKYNLIDDLNLQQYVTEMNGPVAATAKFDLPIKKSFVSVKAMPS